MLSSLEIQFVTVEGDVQTTQRNFSCDFDVKAATAVALLEQKYRSS